MAEEPREQMATASKATAGYASPYPYLERLQEKMEERLARKVPVNGRFCGFCYGRLREADEACPYCSRQVGDTATVAVIPDPVLLAYKARQRTEATWVYMGAFLGLIIASGLFLLMVVWGPGLLGHPALAFVVLIGGGYLLAQLFGPIIAGQFGYRRGSRKRDQLWAAWLQERDGGRGA
jgi:hypothetical protein